MTNDGPQDGVEPESPIEWIFTFGWGQEHAGCFCRITGTFDSARREMFRRALDGNGRCNTRARKQQAYGSSA
jgi:hypothetical protein